MRRAMSTAETDQPTAAQHAGPLRVLVSAAAQDEFGGAIIDSLEGEPCDIVVAESVQPGVDIDVAFLSRDVTAESTKHWAAPATQAFYDRLSGAAGLRWLHVHSSGADRPIFDELRLRGVRLTTSSGSNASVVVQTVLGAILSLGRRLPQLMREQQRGHWAPLVVTGQPPDLEGQTVLVVGWGPIGRALGAQLRGLGMNVAVVRHGEESAGPGFETCSYDGLDALLPRADWLVLACPLTARTRGLIGAPQLALLPQGAHVVNVARGEIMPEATLLEAFRGGRLAGGLLDVFEHEPLPPDSPLWSLPNVIVTPHTASHSAGNNARVGNIFIDNLRRFRTGEPLLHLAV